MSEFKKETVVREANVCFDGKVTSRSVVFEDGATKTLGFMLAGELFDVPANSRFDLAVKEFADYCCSYLEA